MQLHLALLAVHALVPQTQRPPRASRRVVAVRAETETSPSYLEKLSRKAGTREDIPWRRVAAPPRPRRGYSVEASRGDAAGAKWLVRAGEGT